MSYRADKEVAAMTLEDAQARLSSLVYEAACFAERLEHAGKLMGNGHHFAQDVAGYAEAKLAERWDKEAERKMLAERTYRFVQSQHPESLNYDKTESAGTSGIGDSVAGVG